MSTYRLEHLFKPQRVAIVGASPRPRSLGNAVLRNMRDAQFPGAIELVNPKHQAIDGQACVRSLADLPTPPDLAVIATPARAIPAIVGAAGERGVKAAIILSAGLGHGPGSMAEAVRLSARRHGLRIVGPNCLGVLAPPARLNASFAARLPGPGRLALISQSGAVAAGVIEWACARRVGLSGIASLGDGVDVDFGDCLDYFAEDAATRAILLYVEAISDARKFMSAARAAARVKPVIVIKSGRHGEGAKAAATHTGALAGSDAVYDAAFRRAGLVRAIDLDELFAAAETLARQAPFAGDRIAIITNGGGLGVLAVDRLIDLGGRLAPLGAETLARLDGVLPPLWSRANPVDIIGDAPPERYEAALKILLEDQDNDAILVMNCPTAIASSAEAAAAVIETVRKADKPRPVFSVWLGADDDIQQRFEEAAMPAYATESDAVRGIMHVVRYKRRLKTLTRIEEPAASQIRPDRARAGGIVAAALADNRVWLDPVEAADLLRAYEIPVTPIERARDAREAAAKAAPMLAARQGCVVKILSRDIVHKSDVDGVRLNLTTADAVAEAAASIPERAAALRPQARIDGVTVQPMIVRPKARELIAGMTLDPTFGPVILFGHGGIAVEIMDDKALDLLPLDMPGAHRLIGRTRIGKLLSAYRNIAAADTDAIALNLVRLSRLVEDMPDIVSLDLNPLLADHDGVVVLDARIQIAPVSAERDMRAGRRFAIRPYPREWESEIALRDGARVRVRPMRPDDAMRLRKLVEKTTPGDLRMRFLAAIRNFDEALVARLTQLDYARSMAFVAIEPETQDIIAVARLHADSKLQSAEYAILVRSDRQGRGLGRALMELLIRYARAEEFSELWGEILEDNDAMLAMTRALGFEDARDASGSGTRIARLQLKA